MPVLRPSICSASHIYSVCSPDVPGSRLCNKETGSWKFLSVTSQVTKEAITAVEQDGIVFIDEIDKIVTSSDSRYGQRLLCASRLLLNRQICKARSGLKSLDALGMVLCVIYLTLRHMGCTTSTLLTRV